jgi:Class II flagellar assembly regulator
MKITGSGPTAGPSQRRKVSGRNGDRAATAFAEHVSARPLASSGVAPSAPLAALDGVLAAQEVPDPTEQRRRAVRHGHSVLAELRELQLGLVDGWVPEGTLRRLAGLLDGLRPAVEDSQLDALLDDLELRAAVELAKLRRGSA